MNKSRLLGIFLSFAIVFVVTSANATTWTTIDGRVLTQTGTPLCAMVLANGQHMFSCGGSGNYNLNVPLDSNGFITLQVFASGFSPFRQTLTTGQTIGYNAYMDRDASGRAFTITHNESPSSRPGWVLVSGNIDSNGTPLCAMILINGQNMFSCNQNLGRYSLEVPLDSSGNITVQAFAAGFMPYRKTGFVADWIEGKTLYQVILDTEDDDNDGSTTDWLLVAAKYENGIRLLDFSADGIFEVTTGITYEIINGVLTITEGTDIETETITAVDDTKITVNWHASWGDPDATVFEFFTKADAQAYLDELNARSVEEFNMVYTNTFADTVTPCKNRIPPSPHNLVLVTTKNNSVCSLSDVPQISCDVFDTADVTGIPGSIDMYYDFGTTKENNNRGQAIRRQSDNTISGLWVINIFINGEFQGTTECGPVIGTKQ